jgi:hypothetical protein
MNLSGTKDPADKLLTVAEMERATAEMNRETAIKNANMKTALAVAGP